MTLTNQGNINLYVPQGSLDIPNGSEYIKFDNSKELAPTENFTIDVWVKIDAGLGGTDYIIGRGSSYYIQYNADGTVSFTVHGGTGYSSATSTSDIEIGKWNHITGTYEDSQQRIYLNGILSDTNSKPPASINNSTTDSLRIGHPGGLGFDGKVCKLLVYSGNTLTANEVKQLYNGINITNGLVVNCKFDDRKGNKLGDVSGYGHTGSIFGNVSWMDRNIRCWNSRWDESNESIIIETFVDGCDRNYIADNIIPGAVSELYNILGTKVFKDITYTSSNTIVAEPISSFGISGIRSRKVIGIQNFTSSFINPETYFIKLEGIKL